MHYYVKNSDHIEPLRNGERWILMLYKVTPILVAISLHLLPCLGLKAEEGETVIELPLSRVDIYPKHAVALRSGVVDSSEYISGLNPGWKPNHQRLHVDAPGPLIDAKITNSLHDFHGDENRKAVLRTKQGELDRALSEGRRELAHIQQRLDLLQMVGQDMPKDFTSVNAQALSQLLEFISANDAALLAEEHRLAEHIDELSAQRRALLNKLNQRPQGQTLLHLPGAAGSVIRIREDISHMRWAPSYRVEVLADGQVALHRDVQVLSNLSEIMHIPTYTCMHCLRWRIAATTAGI